MITAYRCFRWTDYSPKSVVVPGHSWKRGWNESTINQYRDEPYLAFLPGFYSWKSIEQAVEYADGVWAVAEVELAGKVIEHEHGYRSQYMRVTKIYGGWDGNKVAAFFGVKNAKQYPDSLSNTLGDVGIVCLFLAIIFAAIAILVGLGVSWIQ